ncbi:LutC/YkgG family protein [Yinghuangia seranimata]|uniref:LutC/YkgG family protein n=1 Tax=Yinghuangia seranimata TaxID=408067 RepID=UPI00248AD67B|nr:lactate utilization protein C [Yinghuangia seranimata]MDI2129476.1 lactate utilization protein C [Yinghuangia seranimata]
MSSRDAVLARIRAALVDVPADEAVDGPRPSEASPPRARVARDAVLPLLVEHLRDYRAVVHEVAPDELAGALAEALRRRGCKSVIVPPGTPVAWIAETDGIELLDDTTPLTVDRLDAADGTVTGCAVAIAETGTIVLDAGPGQGRRALTLVPDYHLCVVHAEDVVASVPEAFPRLDARRPLTWISGPSATSDIELDRVEGVHGPRTLEVLLVRPTPGR